MGPNVDSPHLGDNTELVPARYEWKTISHQGLTMYFQCKNPRCITNHPKHGSGGIVSNNLEIGEFNIGRIPVKSVEKKPLR